LVRPRRDPYDLQRFIAAQEPVFARVLAELQGGYKQSHWMWFIFPQFAGLGRSATARYYAIRSREEAAAFLAHPLLGSRLEQCAREVESVEGRSAREIFGSIDALKLHSSMTCLLLSQTGLYLTELSANTLMAGLIRPRWNCWRERRGSDIRFPPSRQSAPGNDDEKTEK